MRPPTLETERLRLRPYAADGSELEVAGTRGAWRRLGEETD